MKNIHNRILSVIAGLVMTSLMSVNADMTTLQWQSTSALQTTGSVHQSRVIDVDAAEYRYKTLPMISTSTMMETGYIPTPFEWLEEEEEEAAAIRRARKGFDTGSETGASEEFPLGEPWVLLLFAALAAAVIALRRRFVVHELKELN